MAITRVTQKMMLQTSMESLQGQLARLARTQEHISTGRTINRPSDSPTGLSVAMRLRASLADQDQYSRNAEDGLGWLGQIDTVLSTVTDQVRRSRDLALQGASTGANSVAARDALATELEQIREGLIASANANYLGRPVFGGITSGSSAYDANGVYVGTPGAVNRTIGEGVTIRVDVDGDDVFGAAGNNLFQQLDDLVTALRTTNQAGIQTGLTALNDALSRVTAVMADVGTRFGRVEAANQLAKDATLGLTTSLADVEATDLPRATVDLHMQEMAYQAALAATARVTQPTLLEFLR